MYDPDDYICEDCDGTGGDCVNGECWSCCGTGYVDAPWTSEHYEPEEYELDVSDE